MYCFRRCVIGGLAIIVSCVPLDGMAEPKPRLFVLTDISNEPDYEESMVRLLVYSNEFDIEGLIATTSTWLRKNTREDLIRRQIEAYGQVRDNLLLHAPGYPTKERLLAVRQCQTTNERITSSSVSDGWCNSSRRGRGGGRDEFVPSARPRPLAPSGIALGQARTEP